jgi:hypothetical protein
MTTALDSRLVPRVLAIIDRVGTNATFKVINSGPTYSHSSRQVTQGTTDVVRKVSPPMARKFYGESDVTRMEETVIYVAASGLSFTPIRGQQVEVASTKYRIENVVELRSGDDVAAYELGIAG